MHKILFLLIICMTALAVFAGCGAADEDGRGLLEVSCGTETAEISIISNNTVIETQYPLHGKCEFYVNSSSVPIDTIIAEEFTHSTNAVRISSSPAVGQRQTASIGVGAYKYPSGGNYGFISVYTNVLGAKVEAKTKYNIDTFSGYTNRYGYAEIPVDGDKYRVKTITISAPGWETEVLDVDIAPKNSNRVYYQVYINRTQPAVQTQTPTPVETTIILGYPTQPVETETPASSPLPLAGIAAGLVLAGLVCRKD